MTTDKIAEEYLRWRFESMKAEAPAGPSAARIIERALPWWERWPERFRALAERLEKMPNRIGHNEGHSEHSLGAYSLPALIVRGDAETEGFVRVLDFKIRDGRLHFRFQAETSLASEDSAFEVTFISNPAARAVLLSPAFGSSEIGYIVYTELPPELAGAWSLLNERERLPFRLILCSGSWA
jgi:hypothetical protein